MEHYLFELKAHELHMMEGFHVLVILSSMTVHNQMSQIEEDPVESKEMKAKYEVMRRFLKVESVLGYENNMSLYLASLQWRIL